MTPGARLAAAIDILSAIDQGERPADDIAAEYFRRRRYIGAKDRVQVATHVYAVLRHRAVIDWWIARISGPREGRDPFVVRPGHGSMGPRLRGEPAASEGPTAHTRSRIIGALLLIDKWTPDDITASFDGGRFRPAALTPAETRLVRGLAGRTLTHPEMPRAVACDLPDWLEPYLASVYGRRLEDEMAALNAPAPLDLRVNSLKADRDTARRALAAEHIHAEPTPWSSLGLRLRHRAPLAATAAFRDGLIEVQDEASQLAAMLADARPGMRVVDFCAGAGGKTLALAARMRNRGKLVACDVASWRLDRAGQRLRRAGISNVERRVLASERDPWVKHHAKSFDRVFVDAPCLGIGSWRRNPDGKWRTTPQDLAELVPRQRDILASAARLVKPGGRLVYATCSLLREENEAQAAAFLDVHSDFSLYPAARAWAETIGGQSPAGEDHFRLTPARHGTDGFFVAIFERKPSDVFPEP
ncbi:MAG: RsmB/NOP family class I SAM-dependent RNA methyltransferase [Alphaproteobacteria bacterium]